MSSLRSAPLRPVWLAALCCSAGLAWAAAPEAPAPAASAASGPALAASVAASAPQAVQGAQALFDRGVGALCAGRSAARAAQRAQAAVPMTQAAEQGHARAQSVLGWMYMTGTGVPRDFEQARRWLLRAAEQGESTAQNNLGVMYAQGLGVPRDAATAERWFRAAADKGAADAQRNLQQLRGGPASPDKRARANPAAQPGQTLVNCKAQANPPRS